VEVGVKAKVVAVLDPQPLVATAVIRPAVVPAVTVIAGVPCPDVMVHPVGTVQA